MTVNVTELLQRREIAGTRYAKALAELREARIDLAAIDATLESGNSGLPTHDRPVRSFHGEADSIPDAWLHPVYAPDGLGSINTAVKTRRDEYTARVADH